VTTSPRLAPLAATLLAGAMAALLDTTIVAVALDELRREFGATLLVVQWVTTAYVLAMAAVIPLVGWSAARFGARRMWVCATALFLIGSVLCGLAGSAGALVSFRVVQGLGGGMILPLTQLTLARAAGPQRLGRVMGVVGLVGQLAPISGPLLGGLLIQSGSWRWIFYVNVPLILLSLLMTWRWFPRDNRSSGQPLDLPGLLLLPTAVVALLYALSDLDAIVLAPIALLLLTLFVVRALRRGSSSLIDLRMFGDRSFRGGTVMMFVLGVTTWGPMLLLPLYYQQLHGLSAFEAGLVLAPQSAGLGMAAMMMGRYNDRIPARTAAAAGMAVAAIGTVPFAFATADTDTVLLGGALLVRGIGFGIASLPIAVAVYRTLSPSAMPGATSASTVVQRIGAATGTAVTAFILQHGGYPTALLWMLLFTLLGLAGTVLLTGRSAPPDRPAHTEPVPEALTKGPGS
jgi:EmrB/QacA subfamily drug resistance transporter